MRTLPPTPTHEKGPGYFLDSERMGRCSWFRALTYSLSEKLKIKETNGINTNQRNKST